MKSEQRNRRLGMLMIAAAATLLAACAMEVDGDEEAWSEQGVLTADELTPFVSDAELAAGAADSEESSKDGDDPTILVSCRRVTASSIPVYVATNSNLVRCRFFEGDVFSHFGFVQSPGFSLRVITWCPRGVPPSEGTTSYAQVAGTVDGGCG